MKGVAIERRTAHSDVMQPIGTPTLCPWVSAPRRWMHMTGSNVTFEEGYGFGLGDGVQQLVEGCQ